jgi:hypothetical protein
MIPMRPPVELLVALERECIGVDNAIARREWEACEASWTRQRRLTHELDIRLRETPPATPEEAASIKKRIDRLARYREAQLKRLRAFNEACATRLATMGRYRSFSKTIDRERRSNLLDVQS